MKLVPSKQFVKNLKKLPPKMRVVLAERLRILATNPQHPLLNDHPLQGGLRGFRSMNVSGDYRLIYQKVGEGILRLMDVDTHHNLYGT